MNIRTRAVTTDIVVFTIRHGQLKVLLIRRAEPPYRGDWALPGGFVAIDEGLDDAAGRELEEETGVTGVYLEQLYTFGAPKRDPPGTCDLCGLLRLDPFRSVADSRGLGRRSGGLVWPYGNARFGFRSRRDSSNSP